ncbi:MAG: nitroreductase [Bacteroides sp.]|nr:nitroreductase [Bacteroides sp.]
MMTEIEALKSRHSIRKYIDRPLSADIIEKLTQKIADLNKRGDLKMQLVINETEAFKGLHGYGQFTNVNNYIMVVGRKSTSLPYRAGYYSEELVIYARQLGLDTCIVGLTYKKVKGTYTIESDEKTVICIAIGYGAEAGRKHKIKSPAQVSNIAPDSPLWFAEGVEAALLAPTAINQQKFHFDYVAPSTADEIPGIKPAAGFSLVGYTKVDLGIAMRNFEIGAGKENFRWIDSPLSD